MVGPRFLASVGLVLVLLCAVVPALAQSRSSGEEASVSVESLAPSPPAGQIARYLIPNYTSQTTNPTTGSRSFTVVTVHNQSTVTCNVGVQFQFAFGVTNVCSITLSIPAGQSRLFCSRPVNDPTAPCSVSCPGVGLTFNTGHAFVSSTNTLFCQFLGVDAQQYFTRDLNDNFIESQSKLSLVTINASNLGD